MADHNIAFSSRDLAVFEKASLDSNAIHTSTEYVRTTHFPSVVVFGALVTLRMLKYAAPARPIRRICASFIGPAHAGVSYRLIAGEHSRGVQKLCLKDGTRVMTELLIEEEDFHNPLDDGALSGSISTVPTAGSESSDPHHDACPDEGTYILSPDDVASLTAALDLPCFPDGSCLQPLLWTSYLAGMKLPGPDAMLLGFDLRVSDLESSDTHFHYRAHMENISPKGIADVRGDLFKGDKLAATVSFRSLIRRPLPEVAVESLLENIQGVTSLDGKVSLIIGGIRGLGECLACALSIKQCAVISTYLNGDNRAKSLQEYLAARFSSRITLLKGDASDLEWCTRARDAIIAAYGRLDYLFLTATPPIQPLSIADNSVTRINGFIQKSISLVTGPLGVFADLLEQVGGTVVFISSTNAGVDLPFWGHYRAAKLASEALVKSTIMEYPKMRGLIVRPPRFLSDQTTFATWDGRAMRREEIAASILLQLGKSVSNDQRISVLESFGPG